jgi:beclin 1
VYHPSVFLRKLIKDLNIDPNLQAQIQERDQLEKEEQRYWKEYSKYKRELLMAEDDFRSLDGQVWTTQSFPFTLV